MHATDSGARSRLRDATSRDAAELAALNVASWRAAYAHLVPESFLSGLDATAWEERLRARLDDPAQFCIAACAGRRLLGYVSGGPIRDAPPERCGEVYALYVDPAHAGRGVGGALLEAAEERLARGGFSRASLWVFTRNAPARRFYQGRGWSLEPQYWYWHQYGLRRRLVCHSKRLASG